MWFEISCQFTKRLRMLALVAVAVSFLATGQSVQAAEQLVIATTGGTFEKELRKYFFDPFTAATGIEVKTVSASGADTITRVKAMVASGNVEWDLYLAGEIQSASELHKTLNEDLTEFCRLYQSDADLVPNTCNHAGVLAGYGTTLLVYNTEAFPGRALRTWADFWDTKTFPGPRALPNFSDPWRVLAAALLADGVPQDKLFPLDVERALRKLDELKPNIALWWKSGDQSTQGFRNGEFVVGQMWQTRATTLKQEGQPIDWSLEQAFLVGDRWALIKGAPHRENALKFLKAFIDNKEGQARYSEVQIATPVRYSAMAMMSPAARKTIPTTPEVMAKLVVPDAKWINANSADLLVRWNTWIQQP
ncbi:ABC transporter substrate-binding protein [Sinorhizobium arboris]|uniref:ABC transporter substrate-binding protein n=1 Tax=Sinorhizobium arboris TaxID=76745 RepID=UPI000402F705|nr:ABC transporter substrate-binding protein [Sinorhizobium arboris]